jgi:tetratricopeptide (TPR) repeat protein
MKNFLALALVFLLVQTDERRALESFDAGDLAAAEAVYLELIAESPGDARVAYNLGTILLMQGRHEEARAYLDMARRGAGELPARGAYNLGNTDLEPAFLDPDLPDREARLRRAIESYKETLLLDSGDEDARWNLELARRLLERDAPPAGGGGGAGGGEGPPATGTPDPSPRPADGPGPQPDAAVTAAESLLAAAQDQELEVQRERLRKPQPPGTIAH